MFNFIINIKFFYYLCYKYYYFYLINIIINKFEKTINIEKQP